MGRAQRGPATQGFIGDLLHRAQRGPATQGYYWLQPLDSVPTGRSLNYITAGWLKGSRNHILAQRLRISNISGSFRMFLVLNPLPGLYIKNTHNDFHGFTSKILPSIFVNFTIFALF